MSTRSINGGLRRRSSHKEEPPASKRPDDVDIKQQRLKAWNPVMTPRVYITVFVMIGVVFVAVGASLLVAANKSVVKREQYDGNGTPESNADCHIEVADAKRVCRVRFTLDDRMKAPLKVYYELENFYQNHRRYVKSLSWRQLHEGKVLRKPKVSKDCYPLTENASRVLHPCGVVPNTLFNDVISLVEPSNVVLKEDEVAWESDVRQLYKQPQGFGWRSVGAAVAAPCLNITDRYCPDSVCREADVGSPCQHYECRGGYYDQYTTRSGSTVKCAAGEDVIFHYARPENYQYLYETFPQVISPIVGVRNEHFAVWMRTAALPHFRKLYGRITEDLSKNTEVVFEIENNFDAEAFSGKKFIVIATEGGFELRFLGLAYLSVGIICVGIASFFFAIQFIKPRKLGDSRLIPWLNH